MSEHQIYEFVAIDRPLTPKQQEELGAVSSRAQITSTRFWNEYHFGGLRAEPDELLAKYFDAHLYTANWGTHRLVLRARAAATMARRAPAPGEGRVARAGRRGADARARQ